MEIAVAFLFLLVNLGYCYSTAETKSTRAYLASCKTKDIFSRPDQCEYYIDCTNGIRNIEKCPSNLHFNPTKRVCDLPDNAKCGSSVEELPEPDLEFSCPCQACLMPSENSCFEYVLCLNRTAYRLSCSAGLEFDGNRNTCTLASEVSCEFSESTSNSMKTMSTNRQLNLTTERSTTAVIFTTTNTKKASPSTDQMSNLTTSKPASRFRCPKSNGLFRYPNRCTSFIHCSNWWPDIKQCAPGTHFSVEFQRCDWPCVAKCDPSIGCHSKAEKTLTDPICACRNCLLPFDKSCTRYYECRDGKSIKKECPKGQTFDRTRYTCDWAHRVACEFNEICPKMNGIFPYKSDCRRFIRCENGIPFIHTCLSIQEFDPDTFRCTYPTGKCSTPEASENFDKKPTARLGNSWQCPSEFGYFRHEDICNQFYHCSHNKSNLSECPKGLQFNSKRLTCDWPQNIDCNLHRYPQMRCRMYDKNIHCPANRSYIQHQHCEMYYDCKTGKACAKRCPDGLYFDDVTATCNHPSNVNCKSRTDSPYSLEQFSEVCQHKKRGFMKDLANSSCYYTCRNTRVIRGCCSKNRVFNELASKCEWR